MIFKVYVKTYVLLMILLLTCSLSYGQVSKGHRILLDKGFQQQAIVFPQNQVAGLPYTIIFNSSRFIASNFTGVNLWAYPIPYSYLGLAPGRFQWGRWMVPEYTPINTLQSSELPYLPKLVSLQLRDEQYFWVPNPFGPNDVALCQSNLDEAKNWFAQMTVKYPDVILHTNQWANPSQWLYYGQVNGTPWLRNYTQYCKPDMLNFDCYMFDGNVPGGSPTDLYANLQYYRVVSLEGVDGTGTSPIPFGLYLQCYEKPVGESLYVISESEMRLNQFAALSFGCKFFNSFIYMSGGPFNSILFGPSSPAPNLQGDRYPTAKFYEMAEINRQVRNLGDAMTRLISTDVRMVMGRHRGSNGLPQANTLPLEVQAWSSSAGPYITGISATNMGSANNGYEGDVVIGYYNVLDETFDGLYEDEQYFMIVNGLTWPNVSGSGAQQTIRINFNFGSSGLSRLKRLNRNTGQSETVLLTHDSGTVYHLDLVLDGGTGDLFKFDNSRPFVNETSVWTNAAGDNLWSNKLNWADRSLPSQSDDVYIGTNTVVGPTINSAILGRSIAVGMSGGNSAKLSMADGSLQAQSLIVGQASGSTGIVEIDGGSIVLSGSLTVGGGGSGSIGQMDIKGGDVNVVSNFIIGDSAGSAGSVNLFNGTLNANTIWFRDSVNVHPWLNIARGKLILPEDQLSNVNTYISNGWIVGYGDVANVIVTDVGDYIEVTATADNCEQVIGYGLKIKGDINNDCIVDFSDWAVFASQWLNKIETAEE